MASVRVSIGIGIMLCSGVLTRLGRVCVDERSIRVLVDDCNVGIARMRGIEAHHIGIVAWDNAIAIASQLLQCTVSFELVSDVHQGMKGQAVAHTDIVVQRI